jgi:hypothetical protein
MAGKRGFVLSGKARAGASVLVSVSVLRGMPTMLGEESRLRDALRDVVVNAEYMFSKQKRLPIMQRIPYPLSHPAFKV